MSRVSARCANPVSKNGLTVRAVYRDDSRCGKDFGGATCDPKGEFGGCCRYVITKTRQLTILTDTITALLDTVVTPARIAAQTVRAAATISLLLLRLPSPKPPHHLALMDAAGGSLMVQSVTQLALWVHAARSGGM